MDYKYLAQLLMPTIKTTVEDIEKRYPKRNLPEGAKVTRLAPSPTGFMHLGNFYGAMIDALLAHQSEGGVFYLRIEDTDVKRQVDGATELITKVFENYGLNVDEGVTIHGEKGEYGPYYQSKRGEIYQTFAKSLIEKGLAYPCFCSEEALSQMRKNQEKLKDNFGYYGKYATCRNLTIEEIEQNLKQGKAFVLRFKSNGSIENKVKFTDLIRGNMELTENDQDHILLKSDGIPTYHFAHVCDDYLMGTTHVVRGEEWLSTLPFHIQLFKSLGIKMPKYIHTSHLMKIDQGAKRKLSKRKDPEASMDYYTKMGFPGICVIEYLMTLINSNYEEWRKANPDKEYTEFPFSPKKMSQSGTLFDIDKFEDVSKNTIAAMTAEEVFTHCTKWAQIHDKPVFEALINDREYAMAIFAIGRGGKKPRKDFASWRDVKGYIDFFYDELFNGKYDFPQNVTLDESVKILNEYLKIYNHEDDASEWFQKITNIAVANGYASKPKEYKENPNEFKGHVGDVSQIIRVALTGRQNSPDMYESMQILGKDRTLARLNFALENL